MNVIAVAISTMKPSDGLRPPSPANPPLMPSARVPGSPFPDCGRHQKRETHQAVATAEPGQRPNDAQELHAGLTFSIAILLAIILPIDGAVAVECRASPVKNGVYWRWREIDGRVCWYEGKHQLPKIALHWVAKPIQRPPGAASAASDGGETLRTTRSPVTAPLTFDARWLGDIHNTEEDDGNLTRPPQRRTPQTDRR
jgi:hypothetical protein